jgi:hypothetical protein
VHDLLIWKRHDYQSTSERLYHIYTDCPTPIVRNIY